MIGKFGIYQLVKLILSILTQIPCYLLIILCFPVNFPAWLMLDILYAKRFGSGIRPNDNPLLTEILARIISWLARSTVAASYVVLLGWIDPSFVMVASAKNFLLSAALIGLSAFQLPALIIDTLHRAWPPFKSFRVADRKYELSFTSPDFDFQIFKISRSEPGALPQSISLMCPCETPFPLPEIISADANSISIEGVFSTRAFNSQGAPTEVPDCARGILRIVFSSEGAAMKIEKWLPLVAEKSVIKRDIHDGERGIVTT